MESQDHERGLVERLRRGNHDAFDAVYAAHRGRIFAFLFRLARRKDVAEDLLQETFLRLARHRERLAPETRLAPFLFTVARNAFVSHRRAAVLDLTRIAEFSLLPRPVGDARTPLALAEAGEATHALEEALSRVPLKYREVILLVCVEGFDPGEAAEVLDLAPATLRQRLSRARAMLRKHLAQGGSR